MTPSTQRSVTIAALLLSQFIGLANGTIVVTAIPAILDDVGGTAVAGTWMVAAAMLGNAVASPVWGRLVDRFSSTALLTVVHLGVIVTACVVGVSQTAAQVIGARFVQGLVLGGLFSLTMIVLANITSPRERGPYVGWMNAANLAGSLVAPLIGGLIVMSPLGWRGTVFVAVPLCAICLVLLRMGMRLPRQQSERVPLDVGGALLFSGTVIPLLIWVTLVADVIEVLSWPTVALGGLTLVCLVGLLVLERRVQAPVIPVRIIARRIVALSAVAGFAAAAAGLPIGVVASIYFQTGRGLTPVVAGLLVVVAGAGTAASAALVGRLSERTGRLRRYMIVGAAILLVGLLLIVVSPPDASYWYLAVLLFVAGFGQGAIMPFALLAAQNSVGLRDIGPISGFMTFLTPLGGAIAVTVVTAVFARILPGLEAQGLTQAEAYAEGMPDAMLVLVGAAAVAIVAAALLPRIRLRHTVDLEEEAPDAEDRDDAEREPGGR